MIEHPAMKHYHGAEGCNCAQAVAKGLEQAHGQHRGLIAELDRCGGGRAEGGRCGALHAARLLVKSEQARQTLTEKFEGMAGAATCREIRKLRRLSCRECVGAAARLAEDARAAQEQGAVQP